MAAPTSIILVNNRISARDTFPASGTFLGIAKRLWSKYSDTLIGVGRSDVGNLIADRERMPIRFQYVDAGGSQVLIEPSEEVAAILAQGADQILWDHVPTGGGPTFRQIFGQHAVDLVSRPAYSNWSCVYQDKPGYGIQAIGPDRNGVIRTITITPSGNYPKTPPTVVSEPPFSDDPCWSRGVLHYTKFHGGGAPWTDLADDWRSGLNPLHALIQELLQKYGFAI
ncbi:hypothetical protein G6O69_18495 [Pseudenhygromyxa sp. WMMC2535]|uniref:hypothetical protein n=1 Tax=Pseudenhygromyxa sp. WMMC2535 TaxID=2712867 RepID=UPI0015536F52|nr:hypothetical protein [Pseudenhygromyxa sp. WMMC2535]NVB39839.1 hypothetical protein [Pseudenhygromyxa sp. WMMC2535]